MAVVPAAVAVVVEEAEEEEEEGEEAEEEAAEEEEEEEAGVVGAAVVQERTLGACITQRFSWTNNGIIPVNNQNASSKFMVLKPLFFALAH